MRNRASSRARAGAGGFALAAFAAVLACLLCAPPAQAHVELVGSTPAAGDRVSLDTTQVVLAFGEDLMRGAGDVVVRDRAGTDVVVGDPMVTGRTVTVQIDLVEPGRHNVSYRVVGLDGHPLIGGYSFRSARVAVAASSKIAPSRIKQALAPSVAATSPEPGIAWLPWTLAGVLLVGLLLMLRGAAVRAPVARVEHDTAHGAKAPSPGPRE